MLYQNHQVASKLRQLLSPSSSTSSSTPEEALLRYESAKTLVIHGGWEEENIDILVDLLKTGSRNAKEETTG